MAWKQTKKEFDASIIEGWRVTIPKTIRRMLKLQKGDIVKITIETQESDEDE